MRQQPPKPIDERSQYHISAGSGPGLTAGSHAVSAGCGGHAFVQPGSYSALVYILMSCRTIGQAVHRIAPYEKLVGDMGTTHLLTDSALNNLTDALSAVKSPLLGVEWRCNFTIQELRQLMVDNVFASWTQYARWLANEATLRQPNDGLLQTLEQHAELQLKGLVRRSRSSGAGEKRQPGGFTGLVENAITNALRLGKIDQTMIAAELGLTPRTLQRRLGAEGARFSHCVERARIAEVARLLEDSGCGISMTVAEIAPRLGYLEPRSLHRAFRRATGMTPGAWRSRVIRD